MILTVLALGGTLLGATTIAGLLTLNQIRNSTNLANSAKAIFAADAGMEWGLYNSLCGDAGRAPCPQEPLGTFGNGATVKVTCVNGANAAVDCTDPDIAGLRSVGAAAGSSRAFEVSF